MADDVRASLLPHCQHSTASGEAPRYYPARHRDAKYFVFYRCGFFFFSFLIFNA